MAQTKFIFGMRDRFFNALFALAKKHPEIVIVSADNGAPTLDQFAFELKDQFYTVGIAEQQMMGMAAGLASEGRKVYTYAIAPFVTTRVHEQNKIDMCAMRLPIVNLGVGAGYAYDVMGPSHHTVEDITIMRVLPHMQIFSPADGATAELLTTASYRNPEPQYIRFDRAGIPDVPRPSAIQIEEGMQIVRAGKDLCIFATGIMVHEALRVAEGFAKQGVSCAVVDVYRVKPLPREHLLACFRNFPILVTYEEHLLAGGFGSAILELANDNGYRNPILRIGQEERFVFENGGRAAIWRKYGLDAEAASTKITRWIESGMRSVQPTIV